MKRPCETTSCPFSSLKVPSWDLCFLAGMVCCGVVYRHTCTCNGLWRACVRDNCPDPDVPAPPPLHLRPEALLPTRDCVFLGEGLHKWNHTVLSGLLHAVSQL